MSGKLYIISTPIGNLSDISSRALEILSSVNLIAAEDTRVSRKLLNHYKIKNKLISYNDFNENFKAKNGYKFSDKSAVDAFINKNSDGAQTFFRDLVSALSNQETYTIQEIKTKIFNS